MQVVRDAAGVRVWAPAKINLFFEVLARRGDGFHEIATLMAPIGLTDELRLEVDPSGELTLSCCWSECAPSRQIYGVLPESRHNLALRAVQLLREVAAIRAGARMQLFKRVPAAAGLGGGSSDAAAALVAANAAWQLNWPVHRLAAIAAELGSDVPFFLQRDAATCTGRGEQIAPLAGIGNWHAVIVKPPVEHSTAQVYAACRPAASPRNMNVCCVAFRRGDCRSVRASCFNRLEEAAKGMSPWIRKLQRMFAKLDCVCSQMSGSGSAYFGIFPSARSARRGAARLRAQGETKLFVVQVGAQKPA